MTRGIPYAQHLALRWGRSGYVPSSSGLASLSRLSPASTIPGGRGSGENQPLAILLAC